MGSVFDENKKLKLRVAALEAENNALRRSSMAHREYDLTIILRGLHTNVDRMTIAPNLLGAEHKITSALARALDKIQEANPNRFEWESWEETDIRWDLV